jgi:ribose transport system substrate-binding protein
MKRSTLIVLRICFAILLGTASFGLVGNLSAIMGRPLVPHMTPVRSPDQPLRFLVVAPQLDSSFWTEVSRGAREAGGLVDADVEFTAPRRASADELLQLLDMATAAQVDGIITQGVQDDRVAQAIAKAADQGIPVILVGADLKGHRLAYVGSDNYEAGRRAATELLRRTGNQAVVGVVRGDFGPEEADPRVLGFRDGLAAASGVKIIAVEASDMNRTVAGQRALKILSEHPEVTALYCTTALDTVGAAQSVKARGLLGKVLVIGWDVQTDDDYVATGAIDMVVGQEAAQMGARAVALLEAYRRRDARPPASTFLPVTFWSRSDRW